MEHKPIYDAAIGGHNDYYYFILTMYDCQGVAVNIPFIKREDDIGKESESAKAYHKLNTLIAKSKYNIDIKGHRQYNEFYYGDKYRVTYDCYLQRELFIELNREYIKNHKYFIMAGFIDDKMIDLIRIINVNKITPTGALSHNELPLFSLGDIDFILSSMVFHRILMHNTINSTKLIVFDRYKYLWQTREIFKLLKEKYIGYEYDKILALSKILPYKSSNNLIENNLNLEDN